MQQALALFRTQRIVKIYLELDTKCSRLTAIVSAENGAVILRVVSSDKTVWHLQI